MDLHLENELKRGRLTMGIAKRAVDRTVEIAGGYVEKTLTARLEGSSQGSFFVGVSSTDELVDLLKEANWTIYESTEGKYILRTEDLVGKEGILKVEDVPEGVTVKTGVLKEREEQYIELESEDDFSGTYETYMIVSTQNPETGEVNEDEPFMVTVFPGTLINGEDTLPGGDYVKIVIK